MDEGANQNLKARMSAGTPGQVARDGHALHLPTLTALLDSLEGAAYLTDTNRRILALGGGAWQSFARENGAPHLAAPDGLIGRDVLDFVQGSPVRRTYERHLGMLATGERAALRFEYRCDAPDRLRRMRMCMSAVRVGGDLYGYLFQSILLSEETRPPIDLFDPAAIQAEAAQHAQRPIVTLCSFCHRVANDDPDAAAWIDPESYYQAGGTSRVRVSHGVCPDCRDRHTDMLIG